MAHTNRLTDRAVRSRPVGLHLDGRGLMLQVTDGADGAHRRSWLYRFVLNGHERRMGLGSLHDVSLAEARDKADEARRLVKLGVDPIEHRKAQRAALARDLAKGRTFQECIDAWLEAHADSWGSEKYRRQQRTLMTTYAVPTLGALPVAAIDTELVLKAIEPIWKTKVVTARRVRDNIEAVLDYAKARSYRSGENPARWRGHLDDLLAEPTKLHTVEHYAALPYAEIGTFMTLLRAREGRDACALELIILTAARLSEVTGMDSSEVDIKNRMWTIPGARMKSGRDHRVPLSEAAIDVIKKVDGGNGLLFPKARDKSIEKLRKRMGYGHVTTHGFRSTFRDWGSETTAYPNEMLEIALAHVVSDKTEAAYRRGDMMEKRRRLMDDWACYCANEPAAGAPAERDNIVPLRAGA
jgi:integrase